MGTKTFAKLFIGYANRWFRLDSRGSSPFAPKHHKIREEILRGITKQLSRAAYEKRRGRQSGTPRRSMRSGKLEIALWQPLGQGRC